MSSPASPEKDQHYIPQFYLKGFSENGNLFVYERFKLIRKSRPQVEAHRPDYYTHVRNDERNEVVENVLGISESRAAPVISKMRPGYVLTAKNAGHLYNFVGMMSVRVPSWRDYLDNLLRSRVSLAGDSPAVSLYTMMRSGDSTLAQLKTMNCQVLFAPKGSFFVTSDSPVYTLRPNGDGTARLGMAIGAEKVIVHFPLNKRAVLRLGRGLNGLMTVVDTKDIQEINRLTMMHASKHLYCCEEQPEISRLFDEYGCQIKTGLNSHLL